MKQSRLLRRVRQFALPALMLIVGLISWQLLVAITKTPPFILPKPTEIVLAFGQYSSVILHAFTITAVEAVGGYLIAVVAGLVIGLSFAQFPWFRACFYPYAILLQTVPIIAIAPLFIMWFGSGIHSVIMVTSIICLFPILANTTQGLLSVEPNLVELFDMFNADGLTKLLKLRVPHALPSIFVGLRISAGISVIGAITGELFAGSNLVGQGGIGYSITYAMSQLQTPLIFAFILVSTLLGFSINFSVVGLEWLLLHNWHASALEKES